MKFLSLVCVLLVAVSQANEPVWQVRQLAGMDVHSVSATSRELGELYQVLNEALSDLRMHDSLEPCRGTAVYVHPDLTSFQAATGAAWYQLALADRSACRIDVQRLAVVAQHGGVERTLRHELFHLAQPADWSRWRAEGEAQRFAGERPTARTYPDVSPTELDAILAAPRSQDEYLRAMATALHWVLLGR